MKPAFVRVNEYVFDSDAWTWSLPAGTSCPFAEACLTKADRHTGKLTHGKKQQFVCYAAVGERFPSVRDRVWANFDAVRHLKTADEIFDVLMFYLPFKVSRIRIHTDGDFFSQKYFDAWLEVVRANQQISFYAFTKSLPYWVSRIDQIPKNLNLTASFGGTHDHLIDDYSLKFARVVYSEQEARDLGLHIDIGDRMAALGRQSFALLENSLRS